MQTEEVTLRRSGLNGEWRHSNAMNRLIIICHGYNSARTNPTLVALAAGLADSGYDTFTFDFTDNTAGFDIAHQVQDVRDVIDRFAEYEELILLGHSFAALTTAIATLQDTRVTRLITLNGFFGSSKLGKENRKSYIKFRFVALLVPRYHKILKYFKSELRPSEVSVPVLVIHSHADQYVSFSQSQKFFTQLGSCHKQFLELSDADHGLSSVEDSNHVIAQIVTWLRT